MSSRVLYFMHKALHAIDGADALSPADIGAAVVGHSHPGSPADSDFNYYRRAAGDTFFLPLTRGSHSATNITLGANQLWATPLIIARPTTFDQIQARVTTAADTHKLRLGIYAANTTTMYPTSLVAGSDQSEITTGAAAATYTNTFSPAITLQPGLYMLACLTETAGMQIRGFGNDLTCLTLGYPDVATSANISWKVAQSYGALPGTFPAGGATQANGVTIGIRPTGYV